MEEKLNENVSSYPTKDDLIRLTLNVNGQSYDLFGTVISAIEPDDIADDPVQKLIEEYIKQKTSTDKKVKYLINEIEVVVKNINYKFNPESRVDYEVKNVKFNEYETSILLIRTLVEFSKKRLTSTLRKVRALVNFRDCKIRDTLLQPNALHKEFRLDLDLVNKCGDKEFSFKLVSR